MTVRFVYFDLGKVLLHFSHEQGYEQIAGASGLMPEQVRAALGDSGLNHRYESGQISTEVFCQQFCQITGASIATHELAAAWSQIFELNSRSMRLAAALQAAGMPIGILSNTSEAHWDYAIRTYPNLKRLFQPTITSFEAGVMKPEVSIYEIARKAAGVAADEIFFTDDRLENVEAARRCGWHAELFESALQLANTLEAAGVQFNR